MKKSASKLLEATSLPGIPLLIRTKYKSSKTVWFISSLVLVALSIKNVADSFTEYYSYEVVTNTDIFRESKSQFPAVSFCLPVKTNTSADTPLLKEALINCKFDQNNCAWQDFESIDIGFGIVCYRFNSGKTIKMKKFQFKICIRPAAKAA